MRSLQAVIAACILVCVGLPAVFATEIEPEGTALRKLQRGFLNVALSPIEISNELAKEVKNDVAPPSWLTGFGRGSIYMVGRALMGVYEIVTFPLEAPAGYKPILKPEFPWQYLPAEKS